MHPHRLGIALRAQLAPAVLAVADQFLLLGVDRDRRLSVRLKRLDLRVDVLELRIPVGMAGAFPGLAVGLQAEAELRQQPAHQLVADPESLLVQGLRQMTLALAHPQQRGLGIAPDRRDHQLLQRRHQARLRLGRRLASRSRPPDTPRRLVPPRLQLGQPTPDRAAGNAGGA